MQHPKHCDKDEENISNVNLRFKKFRQITMVLFLKYYLALSPNKLNENILNISLITCIKHVANVDSIEVVMLINLNSYFALGSNLTFFLLFFLFYRILRGVEHHSLTTLGNTTTFNLLLH